MQKPPAATSRPKAHEPQAGASTLKLSAAPTAFTARDFSLTARTPGGRATLSPSGCKETAPATSTAVPVFTAQPFTPPDHEITWGIGVGSHIRRNKLFWFAALDSTHRNDPALSTVKWPTELLCSALQRPDATARRAVGYKHKLRTRQILADARDARRLCSVPRRALHRNGAALPASTGRPPSATALPLKESAPTGTRPAAGSPVSQRSTGTTASDRARPASSGCSPVGKPFVTPNLLAVTQASVGRTIRSAHAETPSAFEQTLNQNVWGQLPQIVVDSRYGFTIGNPSRFGQGSYPDERFLPRYRSRSTGSTAACWSRPVWMLATMPMSPACCATRPAPTTTPMSRTSSPMRSSLAPSDSPTRWTNSTSTTATRPGKVWRDSTGQLRGLGYLPCYSHYSQMMGPADWHLSTNDWAGFATAQWQPSKFAVFSAGLRWEREQLPPPIATLANPDLPLTGKMPNLGNNWGPRVSLAVGGS